MTGVDRSSGNAGGVAMVLFRDDLRLDDNPALERAVASGMALLCVHVRDRTDGVRQPGGAQQWFLHHGLVSLSEKLAAIGGRLDVFDGEANAILLKLAETQGVALVTWNRRVREAERNQDAALKSALKARGIAAESFQGNLLHEPQRLRTGSGGSFRVYSPFWRALVALGEPRLPLAAPATIRTAPEAQGTCSIASLGLLPEKPDWAKGWDAIWPKGEAGAQTMLDRFLSGGIRGYAEGRDFPSRPQVSRLSPYLRFGMISPYRIWHSARMAEQAGRAGARDTEKFLKELAWREFSHHLLFHHPDLERENFQKKFDAFPWQDGQARQIAAWQRGQTGYPIVDAGMRELWQTGYMHNRVRMIVASFLVKHLLVDWRAGEAWFWDTLVDGDPANNPASWQWVAGSGADAAPYFRIFNPILQGRKFDPDGAYVRRYVPEIAALPDRFLHAPWEAPAEILARASLRLGEDYPRPIVDHDMARERALSAFAATGPGGNGQPDAAE